MAEPVKVGFERSIAVLPISALLPLKTVPEAIKQSVKFKQIARSVSEIGIIEPLVVARSKDQKGTVPAARRPHAPRCADRHRGNGGPLPDRCRRRSLHVQQADQSPRHSSGAFHDRASHRARRLGGEARQGAESRRQGHQASPGHARRHLSGGRRAAEGQVGELQNVRGAAQDEADAPDRGGRADEHGWQLHVQLCEGAARRHSASRSGQIRRAEADRRHDARADGAHGARDGEGATRPEDASNRDTARTCSSW